MYGHVSHDQMEISVHASALKNHIMARAGLSDAIHFLQISGS